MLFVAVSAECREIYAFCYGAVYSVLYTVYSKIVSRCPKMYYNKTIGTRDTTKLKEGGFNNAGLV